ncbi:integral membrane protein [Theileria orientalis strain Shintoku]|uniref:Vesicle transport protein n=1 Tax=Theileria orientalis strain Shintoku TaxID=869250 RepID=J4CDD1_THEOR|nr:integral membrane protein [Theileria orientalis strain Shintoku]BAM40932.1 integral membrane protein [Theileria orientalis strain Shintoku]|eukprot:XP_009691233.1 integral membrane protein [Theileria orientalis strain Shintoku]
MLGDNATLNGFSNKSDQNFLLKGIDFSSTSSMNKFGLLSSMNRFGSWGRTDSGWKGYTNYKVFLVTLACSIFFFVMAFLALPFIVFAPYKFGLMFTIASILFLVSMSFLRGFGSLLEHFMAPKRLVFTAFYFISLVATLVFTLVYPMYLMAFLSSGVELLALVTLMISYIPGGAGAIKAMYSSLWSYIKGKKSDLPL